MEEITVTDDGLYEDYADEYAGYDVGEPQGGHVDYIDGGVLDRRSAKHSIHLIALLICL